MAILLRREEPFARTLRSLFEAFFGVDTVRGQQKGKKELGGSYLSQKGVGKKGKRGLKITIRGKNEVT